MSSRLGVSRTFFIPECVNIPTNSIVLVSGSVDYLNAKELLLPASVPCLFLVDEHVRSKRTPTSQNLDWHRLRHKVFGGSTQFMALIAHRSQDTFTLPPSSNLIRTIAHLVDFGTPAYDDPPGIETPHELDELLHPSDLDRPVRYATPRSTSGWAVRSLTCDELGVAFGLPSGVRALLSSRSIFPFVPIQILDACLHAFTRTLVSVPHFQAPVSVLVKPVTTETWLPLIGKFLSHSWIDSAVVTAKAAKRDDAGVPEHLWNLRITLVLPHVSVVLDRFRILLHQRQRHRLAAEFQCYLATEYGVDWRVQLANVRPLKRRKGGSGVSFSDSEFSDSDSDSELDPKQLQLTQDFRVGMDILVQWSQSTWWKWDGGSTLIFWRWPSGVQRCSARDGLEPYICGQLPRFKRPSRKPKPEVAALILPKLQKLLDRHYASYDPEDENFVTSLIDNFSVPKDDDIRVVWNGTSCGLNDAVWAPNFWLPTAKTASNLLNYNYCSVDVDLGEMFHNFPLPEVFRKYSGIDYTPYRDAINVESNPERPVHARWDRCWMGFRPSPYYAVRFYYWAEELARGDRLAPSNPLRWDEIRLNLPSSYTHNPTLPRVMKWDNLIDNIAGDVVAFVDDLRTSGVDEERAWAIGRRMAATFQYLGIQDAPRKRRPPMRITGAWAGTLFAATATNIEKFLSQSKWNRGRDDVTACLEKLESDTTEGGPFLNHKKLEQDTGFLCHIAMTYPQIMAYLKGSYLTLSEHLPNRGKDGWKQTDRQWVAYVHQQLSDGTMSLEQADYALRPPDFDSSSVPLMARAVPRLIWDMRALKEFFSCTTAPRVCVRSTMLFILKYGFVDASGCGVGATITTPSGLRFREGVWGVDSSDESSNWREYTNLVEFLENEAALGNLEGATVYLCTDNSVAEAAANKNNSTSEKLFKLTVRLRKIEMHHGARIIVTHVSGERMKHQGTDGISRGQPKEGVAMGHNMLSYIPFDESALDRSPKLKGWLESWIPGDVEFLDPTGWFVRGHDIIGGATNDSGFYIPQTKSGNYVWTPPPAAAEVALEQLRQARIKRQASLHVFVCPRLMTCEWIKQLWKASDLVFEVPIKCDWWPFEMFEPLTIGILFPFVPHSPWQLRGTPKMFYVARELRRLFKETELAPGNFLRQLLLDCQRLQSVSKDVVWKMLHFRPRSKVPCQDSRGRGGNKR
jgi:hypothetical protein